MNKLLVLMLAVCLVSVHAFVKRDTATAAQPNDLNLDSVVKDLKALGDTVSKEFSKAIDPEKIKSEFSTFVDKLNELVKPKQDAPKA